MSLPDLTWRSLVGWPALRRRAVRDAVAAHFVRGLRRTLGSALLIGALLGWILFRHVLPLIPWFGQNPSDLVTLFIFAIQHLGDILAGVLVVGQAGLASSWELAELRGRQRFLSVEADGIDPAEYLLLPRVYALAALFVFIQFLFKVVAVLAAVYGTLALDARFYGPEVGHHLVGQGSSILLGYGINGTLDLAMAIACCALPEAPLRRREPAGLVAIVFRRALVLMFVGKLLYFALAL